MMWFTGLTPTNEAMASFPQVPENATNELFPELNEHIHIKKSSYLVPGPPFLSER